MSKSFDQDRAERAISELLAALGEDLERDGIRDTPKRVARALKENFQGLYQDPKDVLTTTFDLGHEELIIVKDIEVYSHCEHHLTPFFWSRPYWLYPRRIRKSNWVIKASQTCRSLCQTSSGAREANDSDCRFNG